MINLTKKEAERFIFESYCLHCFNSQTQELTLEEIDSTIECLNCQNETVGIAEVEFLGDVECDRCFSTISYPCSFESDVIRCPKCNNLVYLEDLEDLEDDDI